MCMIKMGDLQKRYKGFCRNTHCTHGGKKNLEFIMSEHCRYCEYNTLFEFSSILDELKKDISLLNNMNSQEEHTLHLEIEAAVEKGQIYLLKQDI